MTQGSRLTIRNERKNTMCSSFGTNWVIGA
jgi:hypothetical protein